MDAPLLSGSGEPSAGLQAYSTPVGKKRAGTRTTYKNVKDPSLHVANKLGTFTGVFVPCLLSIFGVILFLRLGWAIGEAGFLGAFLILSVATFVILLTVLSISAISTNGEMGGGGAYYMISRALGPEFGGAIGVMFYLAAALGTTFYLVGFAESMEKVLGVESRWSATLIGTLALGVLTVIALVGAELFAKTSVGIFVVLVVSIAFGMGSMLFESVGKVDGYTGPRWGTFSDNFLWDFEGGENFLTVFSIVFPAVTGVMAGANMSGDLADPGRSIPTGTLRALGLAYVVYIALAGAIAAGVTRAVLVSDNFVLQNVCVWEYLIVAGVFASTISSALASIVGAARVLQALAKDNLIPVLKPFARGFGPNHEPRYAVMLTWLIAQAGLMAGSLNAIAPVITLFFLISYATTNLACFVLRVTGAPNFRPSFRTFSWKTSLLGFLCCLLMMFLTNPLYSLVAVVVMGVVFIYIHWLAPSTQWGDITQAIIYHQVRKYLLRLDESKQHLKFWRPSLLLVSTSPDEDINLMQFANFLKKGGLYVIGHPLLGDIRTAGDRALYSKAAFTQLVREMALKAFPEMVIGSSWRECVATLLITAGVGGMRPNSLLLPFLTDKAPHRAPASRMLSESFSRNERGRPSSASLFDDGSGGGGAAAARAEPLETVHSSLTVRAYVNSIHDALYFGKNVLIARNFHMFNAAVVREYAETRDTRSWLARKLSKRPRGDKMTVDVWPLYSPDASYENTLALALQMGCVLDMTRKFGVYTSLRLLTFVNNEEAAVREQERLEALLTQYRIRVDEISVLDITTRNLRTYEDMVAKYTDHTTDMEYVNREELFNALPVLERNRCLNELVKQESDRTAVVLMTLPEPPVHEEHFDAYMEEVDVLTQELPPVLLIHGQRKVITTEL